MIILSVIAAGHESTEKGKQSLEVQFLSVCSVNSFFLGGGWPSARIADQSARGKSDLDSYGSGGI